MTTPTAAKPPAAPLLVWWILWFAMTTGLILQRVVIGSKVNVSSNTIGYIALAPLVISALIRFLVLPRLKTKAKAFPFFVAGLATAEACGLTGLFLGGSHRDPIFAVGLGMLLAYVPIFVRNYDGGGNTSPFRQ